MTVNVTGEQVWDETDFKVLRIVVDSWTNLQCHQINMKIKVWCGRDSEYSVQYNGIYVSLASRRIGDRCLISCQNTESSFISSVSVADRQKENAMTTEHSITNANWSQRRDLNVYRGERVRAF